MGKKKRRSKSGKKSSSKRVPRLGDPDYVFPDIDSDPAHDERIILPALANLSEAIHDRVSEDDLIHLLAESLTGIASLDEILKGFVRRSLLLRDHREYLKRLHGKKKGKGTK